MAIEYCKVFPIVLLLSIFFNVEAQQRTFDITKYGAKTGADSTQAVTSAWKAACASTTGSKVVIPKGTFHVKNLKLQGPCKAVIGIQLQGTLQAPGDVSQQSKKDPWISIQYVEDFTLDGGGTFDGNGQNTWSQKKANKLEFSQPTNLGLNFLTNAVIQDITSLNSKMFHINVLGCKGITLERIKTKAPAESPNTDGIHVGRSNGVKIEDCTLETGDDCISLGDGSQQVTVNRAKCGPGHGIAIGSLGLYDNEQPVKGVFVKSSTLTGTMSGLRIKTWQNSRVGEASDIHFEDIKMSNVANPIIIDQEYCPKQNCPSSSTPSKVKISNVGFKGITGTSSTQEVVKLVCSKSYPCTGVEIGDINLSYNGGGATSVCTNVQPKLSGHQVPSVCTGSSSSSNSGNNKSSGSNNKSSGSSHSGNNKSNSGNNKSSGSNSARSEASARSKAGARSKSSDDNK